MLEIRVKTISSRDNPIVRDYRELAGEPDASGARLLLDGAHLVREAHAAHMEFESVAVAASRLIEPTEEGELARALDAEGIAVINVVDEVFAAISPVRTPSGIIAIAGRTPVDPSAIWNMRNGFTLVAVDVQDPGNVGAIVRTAEAGGVTGVVVSGASANPFSWKALRGSMGSALRLPIVAGMTTEAVMNCMAEADLRMIAAVPRGGESPDDVDWRGAVGLFVGGEGPGLSDEVVARCSVRVTIPMAVTVESLNVAVATGILIYAARRQRINP